MNSLVFYLRKRGFNLRKAVLIGDNENIELFHNLIRKDLYLGYELVGYFHDFKLDKYQIPYLGMKEGLEEFLDKRKVNEVILGDSKIDGDGVADLKKITDQKGIRVRLVPDFYSHRNHYVIKFFGNIPTISLQKEPLEETYNKLIKRLFDIIFSFLVLVFICSWLFLIIGILVKLSSKGPIFFKQKRLGRDRKEFWCYKFRSMRVNDDSDLKMATRGDNRITGIGAILRKTSLDEFPQFWNVLKGEMSVVGPRPHMSSQNSEFKEIIENYLLRQLIKPGITGWAQVNGYRGEIENHNDIVNRVTYDIWYLENWTFWLDLKIIFLTAWNIIIGEDKAY